MSTQQKTAGLPNEFFVDSNNFVASNSFSGSSVSKSVSHVIGAEHVAISDKPVILREGDQKHASRITIDVVKQQGRIVQMKISCPCGRHAELDCEYRV